MKALSVRQPWAALIASGRKTIELRSWSTSHRGPLLIVAALQFDKRGAHWNIDGSRGAAVCIVDLLHVRPVDPDDTHTACFPAAGFAWILGNPRAVRPVHVRGALGLFNVPDDALTHGQDERRNGRR